MDDRPGQPGSAQQDYLDLTDAQQVEMWTRSLGVTAEDLEQAVAAVGSAVGEVYDFIGRNRAARGDPRIK